MPKMSGYGYVKTFGDDKLSLCIDNDELKDEYRSNGTKIEDSKDIKLTVLLVPDKKHITTNIKTYGKNSNIEFHELGIAENLNAVA